MNLVGAVGSGKTDLVLEVLRALAFSGAPWAYLDLAGTGYRASARFDALASTLLSLGVEALYADTVPEAAGVAARFMRRHAYVTVGEEDPPVRLNILRRLRRKDGRRETPQRVAGRFADVWAVQFSKDARALSPRVAGRTRHGCRRGCKVFLPGWPLHALRHRS